MLVSDDALTANSTGLAVWIRTFPGTIVIRISRVSVQVSSFGYDLYSSVYHFSISTQMLID